MPGRSERQCERLAAGTLFAGLTFTPRRTVPAVGERQHVGRVDREQRTLTQYAAMPMVLNETRTLDAAAGISSAGPLS
jgi:hypothetical protein